jgi:hypothetical protein
MNAVAQLNGFIEEATKRRGCLLSQCGEINNHQASSP